MPPALLAAATEPLQSRLDLIPAGAVVLSFVVLPERLLVFRLETGALSMIVASHARAEVAGLVAEVRRAFQDGRMEPAKNAAGRAFEALLAEALAGVLMIAGALMWFSVPVALFIGSIGAVSVFKAVYIDKRELKCACVGGDSNVPLGFISLTENLMMVGMAIWMLVK